MRKMTHLLLVAGAAMLTGAAPAQRGYDEADFAAVPKFDSHVHANIEDPAFLALARRAGFELLSINVDYPDFPAVADQAAIARRMQAADGRHFRFATTFSMAGFGTPGWTERTIQALDAAFAEGAVAVKVWKNVGMVAKDAAGKRVFIDDPRFDGVMAHLERRGVPLIAHQAEPRNCWLPLDQMTTENDRAYFREHPEYYMFLHPEEPSYEALIAARDRFVARHPKLRFDGAHMGSLEWSVDALAAFLDRHPGTVVDLAARMSNLQVQSNADIRKVRAFFIRYQDRILYGTDLTDSPPDPAARAQNPPATADFAREAETVWRADWRYLATPLAQHVDAIDADVPGLDLPRAVIDKIYWKNARRFFQLERRS
ncbi:amidohydrolase family protein [Sphingosinicella sp. BN140058]|uniref:amidohydrolase family protein n=1 Tax=Sphingosinicella sp. BN140058 TaxID=1892855 RepID=UPI001010DBDA|nr:amidohydrolase family protein [Sphingosinicella sp. BN140058]QAY78200.1 amidohydrolase [Sphingosinicella sp. BN140058]